jgi:hypothetical protein
MEPKFRAIPQFTRSAKYVADVSWSHLEDHLFGYEKDSATMGMPFELDPDFQRAHVWDREKQIRFVEFVLRGGSSARTILFNCPGWQAVRPRPRPDHRFVLVDGKQRLEAARAFLRGDFKAFGYFYKEYTDRLPLEARFTFHVNDLETNAEVLQWYIDVNAGGVAHTTEEIEKVRALLQACGRKGGT